MRRAGKVLGAGFLVTGILLFLVPLFFAPPVDIEKPPERGTVFYDRNGEPLRRLLTEDGLRVDSFAGLDEIPKHLIDATVAVEDQRYFSHGGVDGIGICRAIRDSLKSRRFVSGASTISQQLVKISSPVRSRTLSTKLREIFTARHLEFKLSKSQILEAYLNRLPYGNQLTGCRSAARRYFGKPVSDLSLAESAFIAGLPNRPSYLNPYNNPTAAKKRQTWVLKRMQVEGLISQEEFARVLSEPLTLKSNRSDEFLAPHFVDLCLKHNEEIRSRVDTSLDLKLQAFVEKTVSRRLEKPGFDELHAAVVVIANGTGEVLALTGSRDFFSSESGQINGAWEPRSAGSTLKPFTYLMALEKGFTAASVIPDVEIEYVSSAGAFQPVNFDRRFNGPVSLRRALATSLNVPAIQVLKKVGGPRALQRTMKNDFGFTSLKGNGDAYGLGFTIGNAEVRLLELTNAYACLARLGKWQPYTFRVPCTLGEGTGYPAESRLSRTEVSAVRSFAHQNAWILADILSDNEARAPAFGYDSALRLPFRVAAKTGTSTDFRDSWTVGFTPEYTVGVWMGRFDNRPLPKSLTRGCWCGAYFFAKR